MTNLLYITSNGRNGSGKSAALLGTMQLLLKNIRKVAFFRPIIDTSASDEKDHDIDLLLTHFGIEQEYDEAYAMTLYEARSLINSGKKATVIESVISKLKQLESQYEFILCEGLDASGQDGSFELELSADLADSLSCPVLVLTNGEDKTQQQIIDSSQAVFDFFEERSANIVSCIVHTSSLTSEEESFVKSSLKTGEHSSDPLQTYFLPAEEALAKPTMGDVQRWTNAVILYGEDRLENLVKDYLIAAMQADHFLYHIKQGNLIITPGDRVDILISCIMSRLSETFQNISGIVLTGGFNVSPMVKRLMDGFPTIPFPILAMEGNTSKSMNILSKLYGDIHTGDTRKIDTAIGIFEEKVDTHKLASTAINTKSKKISPKMFEYSLMEMASAHKMRIVLPEGEESRILLATDTLLRRKVADLVLLGNPTKVRQKMNELGLDFEVPIIDPGKSEYFEDFANTYYELRKAKGVSLEIARDIMRDPAYFGTMMLYKDYVDGVVSGSITTTAHTIRPAFEFIKTRPDIPIVSSVILLCLKDRVLVFGDCAVNPNPTADQLASIAINSAKTAKVFGIEPRVAMLSYSTGSSGKGEDVDAVKEATRIAKERAPEILLEGPLQYDAAIDANVAQIKMPGSQVAGQATVFIFPDLSAGNNTYKAVQRAADAIAIGPVLQGLNKPVNDLSRGCTVPDIVNTVAITALQAQEMKGLIK